MTQRFRFLARDQIEEARTFARERRDRSAVRSRRARTAAARRRRTRSADAPWPTFAASSSNLTGIGLERCELVVAVARQRQRTFLGDHATRERDARGRGSRPSQLSSIKPACERILGGDRIARQDHGQRLLHAGEPRQALGAAGARNQAELDFRQGHARAGRRDAKMAGERKSRSPPPIGVPNSAATTGLPHRFDRRNHVGRGRLCAVAGRIPKCRRRR